MSKLAGLINKAAEMIEPNPAHFKVKTGWRNNIRLVNRTRLATPQVLFGDCVVSCSRQRFNEETKLMDLSIDYDSAKQQARSNILTEMTCYLRKIMPQKNPTLTKLYKYYKSIDTYQVRDREWLETNLLDIFLYIKSGMQTEAEQKGLLEVFKKLKEKMIADGIEEPRPRKRRW